MLLNHRREAFVFPILRPTDRLRAPFQFPAFSNEREKFRHEFPIIKNTVEVRTCNSSGDGAVLSSIIFNDEWLHWLQMTRPPHMDFITHDRRTEKRASLRLDCYFVRLQFRLNWEQIQTGFRPAFL